MTTGKINFNSSRSIYKNGTLVGETDRAYSPEGDYYNFDEILVKGDLTNPLEYSGHTIVVEQINMVIGMEVSSSGARGPIWKGIRCKIIK
jgi:hypothetical protein